MTERISLKDTPQGFLQGLNKNELYIKKSGLDLKMLELIKYRVSQINGCAYCLDMHHKEAIHMGETELRLHLLSAWRECPFYTEKEKAVLEFAEALTNVNKQEVDDTVFGELLQFFSKNEIADLTLAIAQINSWNRINKAFRAIPGNYIVGQFE